MFITLDGPDGTGKTTTGLKICKILQEQTGQKVLFTNEPTDTPFGNAIRDIIKQDGTDAAKITELFVQDRAAHVQDVILPKQEEGYVVVCDRYRYSTVCYQQLQGEPVERLIALNQSFPRPDLAFILLPYNGVEMLLERLNQRGGQQDIFEKGSFLKSTIPLFKAMETYFPEDPIVFLDAGQKQETVLQQMIDKIREKMPGVHWK